MSNFLTRMVSRAHGAQPMLRPRARALTEPTKALDAEVYATSDEALPASPEPGKDGQLSAPPRIEARASAPSHTPRSGLRSEGARPLDRERPHAADVVSPILQTDPRVVHAPREERATAADPAQAPRAPDRIARATSASPHALETSTATLQQSPVEPAAPQPKRHAEQLHPERRAERAVERRSERSIERLVRAPMLLDPAVPERPQRVASAADRERPLRVETGRQDAFGERERTPELREELATHTTTIEVRIGRIELRGAKPAATRAPQAGRAKPSVDLAAFTRARQGEP
jgi:hypothetical protein